MGAPALAISPEDHRALVARMQADPAWFVREVLGERLWAKQVEILESVRDNQRTAVRSSHATGKSFTAGRVVPWFLLAFPDSIVVTTAPTATQVRAVVWQEIRRACHRARIPLGPEPLQVEWRIDDGWYAIGRTTKEPDSFQGFHSASGHILVVIDEASGVESPIWEAIDGVLTSDGARLLAIGNPLEGSGPFFAEFKAPGTTKICISAFDTPNFTEFGITLEEIRNDTWRRRIAGPLPFPSLVAPGWVADKHRKWGEGHPLWQAKVEGNFPDASSEKSVFPLSWIEHAKVRDEEELPPGEPIELGVDVARFGPDSTVIVERRGSRARIREVHRKEDTMETVGHVVLALDGTQATTVKVDDASMGGGVTDRLQELEKPVAPINVGEKASDAEHFVNLKAELTWGLRERFRDGDIAIEPDEELEEELAELRFSINSRGQIVVESKDELKKRLKRSPDKMDALILAFAPTRELDPVAVPSLADLTRPSRWRP